MITLNHSRIDESAQHFTTLGYEHRLARERSTEGGLDNRTPVGDRCIVPAMVWKFDGRLAVNVHGPSDPSNLEWSMYLRETLAQTNVSLLRVVIVSHGGRPSGSQRKELTEVLPRPAPTAFLSNSLLSRSLINTMSWFNPQLHAFPLNEDAAAFRFLQLTAAEARIVQRIRAMLEAELKIGAEHRGEQLG